MIDINMGRTLDTKRDQRRVLGRFLTWAKDHGYGHVTIEPNVHELRWNDDFTHLYVSKLSGLIERGFASLYREQQPIFETEKWAVYPDTNPAAHALLTAIREVTAKTAWERV